MVVLHAEQLHGPRSIETARAIDLLVESLWRVGKGGESETRQLAERAIAIKLEVVGEDDPGLVLSLNNLGTVLSMAGDPVTAEESHRRALTILERARVSDDAQIAQTCQNLAILRYSAGDFDEAGDLYERALQIRERTIGPDHIDVALNLNLMGVMYWETGDYVTARPLFERALDIRSRSLRADHPLIAGVLINLAILDADMGDLPAAHDSYRRALEILEESLDPENPLVATTLLNLANVLWRQGENDEAQRLVERALDAWDKKEGPYHVEVAESVNLLGSIESSRQDYEAALVAFERAVDISSKTLEARHPTLARQRIALANTLLRLGKHDLARHHFEEALESLSISLAPEHPDVAAGRVALARYHLDLGETGPALRQALQAEEIGRRHLQLSLRSLAERQSLLYATVRVSGLDLALSLAAVGLDTSGLRDALDALTRSRALVLDEMAIRRRRLSSDADAAVRGLARDLAAARTRLANLMVRASTDTDPDRHAVLVDRARADKERIERELAGTQLTFREILVRQEQGLKEIEAHLPADSALVAYARYLQHRSGDEPRQSYLAFVLRSGNQDPVAVALGPAEEIDRLVARWLEEIRRPTTQKASQLGAALRSRIWDPLVSHLSGISQAFLVPDGALHFVNVAALPSGDDRYVVESDPTIHHLSAERDLIATDASSESGSGLLVIGDPDFDSDGDLARADAQLASATTPQAERSVDCLDLGNVAFSRLPGTAMEAQKIVELWSERREADALQLVGDLATEARFKAAAPGREVVHIATHGFFLRRDCSGVAADGERGVGGLQSADRPGTIPSGAGSLLLRSGLVFAGANHRSAASPGQEDGILTAEEIAGLDLSGVGWAVLSACDTGVGEVVAGEGILGLRRAFQIAGARTLVMSLWSVDDEAGQEWMRRLYDERLTGRSTADAVQRASIGFIEERRRNGKSTHPFYWGAFVAVGSWH